MIIYLILDADEDTFIAAFSTKEKALEFLKVKNLNRHRVDFEEYTLDKGFQK